MTVYFETKPTIQMEITLFRTFICERSLFSIGEQLIHGMSSSFKRTISPENDLSIYRGLSM